MTIDHNLFAADLLLGKLPEKQREEMEQQFFADQALFDELLIAENELTDDYVASRLTPADRVLFEQRFLLNPRQRRRAIFADALIKYASRQNTVVAESESAFKGIWTSIASLFTARTLAFSLGAAAVMLILASVLFLTTRPGNISQSDVATVQVPGTETPAAEYKPSEPAPLPGTGNNASNSTEKIARNTANRTPATPSRPATVLSTIFLTAGSTRGSGGVKVYSVPVNATGIRLRLALEDTSYTSFIAVVETGEGTQIASQKALRSGSDVSLIIPAARLNKGDYVVTLKGFKNGGVAETISEYSFTVD